MSRFVLSLLAAAILLPAGSSTYVSSIEDWRQARESKLKAEDGWLSLTGLFWLQEGENTIGSAQGCRVRLPEGFPANSGKLLRRGGIVTLQPDGAGILLNGHPVTGRPQLKPDKSGAPDVLAIGRLRLHLIERGTKTGVRMKDPQSEARLNFRGLQWFPVDESRRINAKFVPRPRHIVVDAQAGDRQEYDSPGYIEWSDHGQTVRLTPVQEENQLFFIFRDATAGKTTYPAARFLYAEMPKDGRVVIDFNKAYNPPCVFTPYATCPLPPPENRLKIAVDAGEKMYSGH